MGRNGAGARSGSGQRAGGAAKKISAGAAVGRPKHGGIRKGGGQRAMRDADRHMQRIMEHQYIFNPDGFVTGKTSTMSKT